MNNLKTFLDYLHEQFKNHSIYVWGAQGQQGAAITDAISSSVRPCRRSR